MAQLAALVDRCASRCAGSSTRREKNWTPRDLPPHYGRAEPSQRRLRIGLRRSERGIVRDCAAASLAASGRRVYGWRWNVGLSFEMNGLMVPMTRAFEVPDAVHRSGRIARRSGAARRSAPACGTGAGPGAKPKPRRARPPSAGARRAGRRATPTSRPTSRRPCQPPAPPPLPPAVWDAVSAQDCSTTSSRSAAEGLEPRRLRSGRPAGGDRSRRSVACLGRGDRALQPAVVGPCARPCQEAGADRLVRRRQRPRCRQAGRAAARARSPSTTSAAALDGLLPTHPQYAALKAALAVTPASRHGRSATASGSTWTAGAGCRATSARSTSSSTCRASTRRWSRTASTAGSSGRSPASCRPRRRSSSATRDRRDPQSVVGSAQEHREGSRGQEGLRPGQGRRRQDPALAPAAGADQCARPAQVRDAELEGDLPSRHQRPQPLQRQRCAR